MTQELLSEESGSAFARAVIRHETILLFVFDELGEARIEDADLKKACGYALPGRFSARAYAHAVRNLTSSGIIVERKSWLLGRVLYRLARFQSHMRGAS